MTYDWEKGSFPGDLKIAGVTPVFKGGERYKLGNYRPIPCSHNFPKFLSVLCIMTFTNIN